MKKVSQILTLCLFGLMLTFCTKNGGTVPDTDPDHKDTTVVAPPPPPTIYDKLKGKFYVGLDTCIRIYQQQRDTFYGDISTTIDSISPSYLTLKNDAFLYYGDSNANKSKSYLYYYYYVGKASGNVTIDTLTKNMRWRRNEFPVPEYYRGCRADLAPK